MRISKFCIKNYKSYFEEQSFLLTPGFNLIAGQNNVGKTALLEALQLDIRGKPHRSVLSRPQETTPTDRTSSGGIQFVVSGDELKNLVLQTSDNRLTVLLPKDKRFQESAEMLLGHIFEQKEVRLTYQFHAPDKQGFAWIYHPWPSHELYEREGADYYVYEIATDRKSITFSGRTGSPPTQELSALASHILRGRIYRFLPERYGVSSCRFGSSKVLASNGSNLPEVLNRPLA